MNVIITATKEELEKAMEFQKHILDEYPDANVSIRKGIKSDI